MSNLIKTYYWLTFGLSIVSLITNIGIGLIAMAIVLLPTAILHVRNGLNLKHFENDKNLMLAGSRETIIGMTI